ncbi:MAG: AAA family ATPase [Thermoplasmata archaeon]|nr:AAA family ATPase [Thermoplasmata archaeon]
MYSPGSRVRPRVGRPEAWASLVARGQRVLAGQGGISLVEGAEGVGKSTFLELIADEARRWGFRIVAAKATWLEDPPPFRMIGDALKLLAAEPKGEARGPTEPRGSAPLAFQPALEKGKPRFVPMDPLGSMTDDARSDLASDRLGLLRSLAEPLLVAASRSPILLVLHDLDAADEASQSFLIYLLPHIAELPVWVVASCLDEAGSSRAAPETLTALRQKPEVNRVPLRPFTEPEVSEFVGWALPQARFHEAEIRRLHVDSEGVPARVIQRLFPATPPPKSDPAAAGPAPSVTVDLGALDPEAVRVLDFALVAGPKFSARELASAAGLTEERTVGYLKQFQKLGVLAPVDDRHFGFERNETRDQLYARLGPDRIRQDHQRFAEALLRDRASDDAAVFALARHTYLGGLDREAVEYNQRAAAFAAESYQPGLALLYLRLALEALARTTPPDLHLEFKLRLEAVVQQVHVGDVEAADAALESIRSSDRLWGSASPVDRALLWVYRARVLADQGRWDEAEQSLLEMPANLRGLEPGDLRRSALRLKGEIQFYRGNYAAAVEAHEAALDVAQEEGQSREIAAEQIRLATSLSMLPQRAWEVADLYAAAIDRLVELGDNAEAAFGALCLGAYLADQKRSDEARAALHRSIELSEASRDERRSGWAHLNLADLEFGLGRDKPARKEAALARVAFEHVDDDLGTARVALTEGRVALRQGELDAAGSSFETARAIFSTRNLAPDLLESDLRMAELDVARDDLAEARRRLVKLVEEGLPRLRPDLLVDTRRLGERIGPPALDLR